MSAHYDVVIAGGGMVGASLALALGAVFRGDLRVLVVESFELPPGAAEPTFQPSYDARSTALSAGSRRIYEAMGVWEPLGPGLCAIDSIHVSTRGRPGSTLMNAAGEGLPALGYVVENHWLGQVLLARLRCSPGLEWCAPATVEWVRPATTARSRVGLRLGNGQREVSCELLVIADGQLSALARSLGIAYDQTDYGHGAVIANVSTAKPHGGRAFERFTEQGPVAFLPLLSERGDSRSSVVWTLPEALAQATMALGDDDFCQLLQERFGHRLGAIERTGARFQYPISLVEAREQVRTGVVVMGNAAHFIHPVAGQGFNLCLRDIARLVEVLARGRAQGRGLGELSLLEEYLRAQTWDQRKTTLFSDRVSAVFTWSQPLVAVARDLSLSALDMVLPAKSWFVKQAAGLSGDGHRW